MQVWVIPEIFSQGRWFIFTKKLTFLLTNSGVEQCFCGVILRHKVVTTLNCELNWRYSFQTLKSFTEKLVHIRWIGNIGKGLLENTDISLKLYLAWNSVKVEFI